MCGYLNRVHLLSCFFLFFILMNINMNASAGIVDRCLEPASHCWIKIFGIFCANRSFAGIVHGLRDIKQRINQLWIPFVRWNCIHLKVIWIFNECANFMHWLMRHHHDKIVECSRILKASKISSFLKFFILTKTIHFKTIFELNYCTTN